jgi:hypothetical protein
MVGGKVVEIVGCEDKIWLDCVDVHDHGSIYVEKDAKARAIIEGDTVWWQGNKAYWTPAVMEDSDKKRCGIDYDIPLVKIGFSSNVKLEGLRLVEQS